METPLARLWGWLRDHFKDPDRSPVLQAVVVALVVVIGSQVFLGFVVSSLISDVNRALLAALLLIVLVGVAAFVAVRTWSLRASVREEILDQKIDLMTERLGQPAELAIEEIASNERLGAYYYRLADLVRQEATSGDEIIILANYGPNAAHEPADEREGPYKTARDYLSEVLLRKAEEPGIAYRRIMCFDEDPAGPVVKEGRVKPWVIEHCQKMLGLKERKGRPFDISLKKARRRFLPDVLVIGDKVAALEVVLRDPSTEIIGTVGVVIFRSPTNKAIVERLRDYCLQADAEALPVSNAPEA